MRTKESLIILREAKEETKEQVATRAPLAHEQAQSTITNLVTDLSNKEPANSNIQTHVTSSHAPANAQKNSDIIQSEIEAKLTGELTSHTHAGGITEATAIKWGLILGG